MGTFRRFFFLYNLLVFKNKRKIKNNKRLFKIDAIASNDQIRITPSLRSQKGRIWSRDTMPNNDWEIEVSIRINGRGRIGADGMVYLIYILFANLFVFFYGFIK